MKWWILLLVIEKAVTVVAEPKFYSIGITEGSVRGATRLSVYGQDFAAEQFSSPLLGNEGLGNKVWLRSNRADVPCDVLSYYTTRSQIVCDTRVAPGGTYKVSVEVDGVDVESSTGIHCSSCKFTYSQEQTPTIETVTPSSGPPGTLLTVRGKLFSAFFENIQLELGDLEDSLTDRKMQRVFWGNYICDLVDDHGELYGLALDNEGTSNYGTLQCKPRGTYIASQSLSYIISENFGRSMSLPQSVHVSGKNELYHFQSHAVIYNVEPNKGSQAGGLLVTVTGDYFDEDTVVFIGAQPCEIVNVSITTIRCVTSRVDPDASGFPGNRGMNKEIWIGSYMSSLDNVVFDNSAPGFRCESNIGSLGEDKYFIGRLRGFYVPPRDGYYAFSVICDDRSYLFLSSSSREEDKVKIAYCPAQGNDYFAHAEATSVKIFLEGGNHYYMEASLLHWTSAASVNVGVHMYDVPFVHADVGSAINEEQRISVMSVGQKEIQILSRKADVPELQVLIVDYEDCNTTQIATCPPAPRYVLGFMGEETIEIAAGASSEEVESALNSLSTIQPYGVEVFLAEGEDDIYYVSFLTSSENLPELTANIVEGAANITVVEEQYAIPAFDNDLSILIDGVVSAPFSFSSTADEVHDVLLDMITVQCQRTSLSNALYSEDFEGRVQGYETGERTTETEPFCGRTSLKNPGEIFKAGSTVTARGVPLGAFDVQYGAWLCCGFRGSISDTMRLSVAWVDQQGNSRYDAFNVSYEAHPTTRWDYMCTNLGDKIMSEWFAQLFKRRAGVKVHVIELFGDSNAGFYIDNFYIGLVKDNYIRKSLTPKPNNIFIMDISVEKINDSFSITFMAAECGYGFPLMAIEGAFNVSGSVDDEVAEYRNEEWPQKVTIKVTRDQPAAPPIGGTFDLTQNGVTIPAVSVNTSSSKMKSLLEAYFDIGYVNVQRTGSCFGYQWDVTCTSKGGGQPLIQVNDTKVTGNLVSSFSEKLVEGKIFMGPIPGEFLRSFHYTPQVQVVVNGIPSRCDGNCSFEFSSDVTPTVTNVTPDSGNGCDGTSITLVGTGFSSVTDKNNVTIGGEQCVVTNSNSTSIVCTLGATEAGYHNVSLVVEGKGYAEHTNGDTVFKHELKINSFSPNKGSTAGGSEVTFEGCGFSKVIEESNVAVGGKECKVKSADYDRIVCIIAINENYSRRKGDSNATMVVTVNGVTDESSDMFFFSDLLTPIISGISPTVSSVLGGDVLTLTGSGFGTDDANVTLNGKDCNILSHVESEISCIIPGNRPATFPVELRIGNKGFADISAIKRPEYILRVDGICPDHGSLLGGTLLTIKGAGFGNRTDDLLVDFEGYPCEIDSVTDETFTCYTSKASTVHKVYNNSCHERYDVDCEWSPQVLTIRAGDTVIWEWTVPNHKVGIKYTVQQTADIDNDTYDGTGFNAGPATASGRYSYIFTVPGIYYYSSGPMDNADTLSMNGIIHVEDAANLAYSLNVDIGGYSPLYNPGAAFSDSDDNNCSLQTLLQDCKNTSLKPKGSDSSKIYFSYYECSTPSIHNIGPNVGTSEDEITVLGEGFGTLPYQNDLQFGGHTCNIVSVNETTIICSLDVSNEPSVGYWLEASLKVANSGYATILKNNPSERAYTLKPYVRSISHQSGSTAGGLPITLMGTGFSAVTPGNISVLIGSAPCEVSFFNYTTIICTTGKSRVKRSLVEVTVNNVPATVCKTCFFFYALDSTASINSVYPIEFDGYSTQLTIEGDGFPSNPNDVRVTVSDVECSSIRVLANMSSLSCDIGFVPVGDHEVIMNVVNQGNAELIGVRGVESAAVLYDVEPDLGSIRGGQEIAIYGNGFHVDDTAVEIGGKDCLIKSINISGIECITPVLSVGEYEVEVTSASGISYVPITYSTNYAVTPVINSVTPSSGKTGDSITIGGQRFSSVKRQLDVTIDDAPCAIKAAREDLIECTLGKHSAGSFEIVVLKDGIGYAENQDVFFNYSLRAFASGVECGFGGGVTLALNGSGFDENTTVVCVCDRICPIKDISAKDITCEVPGAEESSSTKICDVIVSLPDTGMNVTVSEAVTYRSSLTAHITSVEPRRGGTAGGTTVTITGTGFATSGNTVTIAGTNCEVQTESTTLIVCKTGAHSPTEKAKVRVDVGTGIAVQNNAEFFYIDVWSSVYTWNGTNPPMEGDFVIIPEGQTILLDESTPTLKVLLLQGGHMVFDEKDIELHAEYIIITDGGSLTVGTEDDPFQHEATIMLHGHVRTQELPIFGAKVLAVRNGTLDLHGKPVAITWTYLTSTISPGDTEMTLMQKVGWKIGDKIVIAASGDRLAQKESEVLSITGISDDNMTLTFAPAVKYTHVSLSQTMDDIVLDTRAEVGLLTRNVKFRGSVHEEWTEQIEACDATFDANQFATQTCFLGRFGEETGSDQFGAHIMFSPKEMNKDLAKGRISYIEVTHAGQAFRLGRYPVNFRMSGDITESYVRGCSIYNTFNRAVSVQGVHGFLVEHNVAFNVMGHAFFLEDGIESGNTFQYNLAVFVRPSSSLLNVDVTPAAYWITNPNNTVRHNAAAGCSHFGFWYNAPVHPKGPSFTSDVYPRKLPLGQFYNNTAHTVGRYGLWIFPVYTPSEPAKFDKFSAWEVLLGAKAVKVGRVQFHNFLISDAKISGLEFKTVVAPPWGKNGGYINKSVVIGYSNVNSNRENGECTSVGVQLPMSKYLTVDGAKFINFDRSNCVAIKACGHCKVYQGGFHTRFKKLKWSNTPNIAAFKWEHECWFEDLDGSLTGNPNYILVPQNDNLPPSHCKFDVGNSSFGAVPGAICDDTVKLHRFAWNRPSPVSLLYKNVLLKNKYGESTIPFLKARITHRKGWMATLVEGENYNMRFENVGHITNISYMGRFDEFKEGEYVYITHNFTQKPDAFAVAGFVSNGMDDIPDPTTSNHGNFTFNNNTRQLTYIVTGNGESSPRNKFVDLDVYRCYYKDCIPPVPEPLSGTSARRPTEYRNWSDVESWADAPDGWGGNKGRGNYGLPEDGDNVQIIAGVWMVADIALPQMNKLFIYGTLEFEDKLNFVVNATYILIHGGRLVAGFSEEKPFTHQLRFILQGTHSTQDILLPNGSTMGSKVLGVYGRLDLHGVTRKVTWSHLAATVFVNSNIIQLVEDTDWGEGDEIIVTTTSYETWETETFAIIEKIDEFTFRLNSSFEYNHIANTYQLSDSSSKYTLSAEVGLLTRNIVLEGANYGDLSEESFGARVLVGKLNQNGEEFKGSAKISNVQFKYTGQAGWTGFQDSRDSLAFLHIGVVTEDLPSYVKGCSFHYCFTTAIGIYGTHGIEVSDNVIHNVVGHGIIIGSGGDDRIIHNLVALVIPKRLKYKEENNPLIKETAITDNLECQFHEDPRSLIWNGGIEIVKAIRPVLINNTVAGSERVGFKVKGEPCSGPRDPDAKWYGNVAHSTLHGVHLKDESKSGCSMVSNFFIWNSFDYGVYAQIPSSLSVADSVLVDNKGGVFALIVGPPAIKHRTSNKVVEVKDSVLVGTSPSYDCNAVSPEAALDTEVHRNQLAPGGGNVGFFIAVFMSSRNGAYFHSLSGVKSYPTIRGVSKLTGVKFSDYGNTCGKKHVTIMTNPASSDASHPVHMQDISFVNVPEENYVWIHRPSLELVNPSDCVDMDCDGMKKAIIRDLDGSMLGDVGTVIPQSEFEWNGDRRRGLGDFRIPRTMLTKPDGGRISVPPHKGIYRGNNDCDWVDDWQAYKCHNLDHMMMVVESMDADTETRRVSPVSLSSNGYVDLINGPRDYGCCYGYTCQERISTFYTIVATGRYYDLHFTGTTPQKLRYHLLNADNTQSVVVSTYYSNPQRLDVYVNGNYITPTNGVTENGVFTWKAPELDKTSTDYYPSLNSSVLGSNFFDRDLDQLFVLIRGPTIIEVVTTSIIMVTFGVPAVEVDNFFEENLVKNLASLLDIPPSKIRVVKIISEDSVRRSRRSAEEVHVVVEIGNQPSATSSSDVSTTTAVNLGAVPHDDIRLSFDNLLEVQSKLVNEFQTEGLARAFNFEVTYLSVVDPVDSPVDPTGGVRATIETGGTPHDTGQTYAEKQANEEAKKTKTSTPMVYHQPSKLIIVQEPGEATKGKPFLKQPKIKVVDAVENIVEQLGHASRPWVLGVALRRTAVSEIASLSGVTTCSFTKGWFNFTNLAIDTSGTGFILDFTLIYPTTSSLSTNSAEVEVTKDDDEDVPGSPYDDFSYSHSYSIDDFKVNAKECGGQPSAPLGPGTDDKRVDSDSISYNDVIRGDPGVDSDSYSLDGVNGNAREGGAQPSAPLGPGTDGEGVDSDSISYNDVIIGDPGVNSDSISYNDVIIGDPGVDSDSYSLDDVNGNAREGGAQPSAPLGPGTDGEGVDSDSISYNDVILGDPGVSSDSISYNDVIGNVGDGGAQPSVQNGQGEDVNINDSDSYSVD